MITSCSTETKAYSQITDCTTSPKNTYKDDVLSEEIEVVEHIERKFKSIDRDDIEFIHKLNGCIVKMDTDFLSMVSRAAPKKEQ